MTTTTDYIAPEVEDYRVFLSPAEYALTVAKIEKINARAAKRGFTGRIDLVAERVERTSTNALGLKVTKVGYMTRVSGSAPKYNGWTFVARVDWEQAGAVIAMAPGSQVTVDRSVLVPGHCAHCDTARFRKNTYVVVSEDGTQVQVGSTCIKDFLGWQGSLSFISESDVEREVDGFAGTGEPTYSVLTVLAASWATIATTGYVRADAYEGIPTKNVVDRVINGTYLHDDARMVATVEAIRTRVPEAAERAAEILAFLQSDEFGGDSEYVRNLKVVAAGTEVSGRSFGLLVSAPQAWIRHNETAADREAKRLAREAEKASMTNAFVGQPGDKVEVTVTVKAIRFIDSDWGTTTLYTLVDPDGNLFKWFSTNQALGRDSEGETFTIKGTVKKHDEYQGTKSTVLTRCKEVKA